MAISNLDMTTIDTQRQRIISRLVMRRPEEFLVVTIHLWERLASDLVSLIGEGGFQSLYARSMHVTGRTFPWIVLNQSSVPVDLRFTGLKMSLEERDFTDASEASVVLLCTFIDILSSLIGELLTTSILRSAWGDNALDIAVKGQQQ